MSKVINTEEYRRLVDVEKKTVLVDFYADWCGPCKMMGPVVDAVAAEYDEEQLMVVKVNVDNDRDVAMENDVMSIPTLILFKDGEAKDTNIGAVSKEQLKEFIEKNL